MKELVDSFDSKESPIWKPFNKKTSLFAIKSGVEIPNLKDGGLNNSSLHGLERVFFDEAEGLDVVLTTPFEKVIKILERVKKTLEDLNQPKDFVSEVAWVIKRIQNNDYYNYDFNDQTVMEFEKYCEESNEVKTFFEILNENSEGNLRRKRKVFGTANISDETKKNRFLEELKLKTTKLKEKNKNRSVIAEFPKESGLSNDSRLSTFSYLKTGEVELEDIFSLDFNIFDAEKEVGESHIFPVLAKNILKSLSMIELIAERNLDEFLVTACKGYKKNPYHKALHGVDVMHTTAMFIVHTNLTEIIHLTSHDILSMLISALLHDIGHPGLNNNYQINSQSELALTYNDKSVLENFHIAESSKLLRKPTCNILANFSELEFKSFRKRMIDSILFTDMVLHARCQTVMKNRVEESKKNNLPLIEKSVDNLFDQQQEVINFLIHTADISHSSKKFEISYKWSMFLMEEFWSQGDMEKMKKMPVSFLCDRTTAEVPKSQMGFIRGLIVPLFDVLVDFLPDLYFMRRNIEDNLVRWNDLIGKDREDGFLEKLNNIKDRLSMDKKEILSKLDEAEASHHVEGGKIFDFSVHRSSRVEAEADSVIDYSKFELPKNDEFEDVEIEENLNLDNKNR